MINEKYVTLRGGTKVKVQEVQVKTIISGLPFLGDLVGGKAAAGDDGDVKKTFAENVDGLLAATCGLSATDLLYLYPSDLDQIWQAFREVNGFFFGMAEKLGVAEQLGAILRSLLDGFGSQLSSLLKEGIQTALNTGSAGLSPQSSIPSGAENTES